MKPGFRACSSLPKRPARLAWLLVLMLGSVWLGCRPSRPPAYRAARAAAERAYAHGRYEEAATHWLDAELRADSRRDRHEAVLRASAAWQKASKPERATALCDRLLQTDAAEDLLARCAYENARRALERDARAGPLALLRVLERFPDSVVAPFAFDAYRDALEAERQDPLPHFTHLLSILGKRPSREQDDNAADLEERVRYFRAEELERQRQWGAARDAYLETADRFPYPSGALWDDALWHAAELEVVLGRPKAAIGHLERMLREREPAGVQGSYERFRFAYARFRIAELLRDALKDPSAAEREFLRLWNEHRSSLLADDALFNAILLAKQQGAATRACKMLETLKGAAPASRYLRCQSLVCPTAPASARRCPAYIQKAIERGHVLLADRTYEPAKIASP